MRYSFYFVVLSLLFISCHEKGHLEKINFKSEYKFSNDIETQVEKDTVPWKHQISAGEYASKGDYRNALRHWDLAVGTGEPNYEQHLSDSINTIHDRVHAKDYIIQKAKAHQIVIINEAHHSSHHRFFTRTLLQELFNNGYRYLGLEALGNGKYIDSLLNERNYPIQQTGWYIKEPQFGNLTREALKIGYILFPYETTTNANGKQREIDQATNIQQFIQQHQNEKILIHCGFDHALEGRHNAWEKAMAGRLQEFTGLDPLTINQVVYSEKSDSKFNHPLQKTIAPTGPTVLIDKNNEPFRFTRGNAWTDIAVFHSNTHYELNRPHWLFTNQNQKVHIELTGVDLYYPLMVMAFEAGEDINQAVPVDLYEVSDSENKCALGLKKGDYNIVITDGIESYKYQKSIN